MVARLNPHRPSTLLVLIWAAVALAPAVAGAQTAPSAPVNNAAEATAASAQDALFAEPYIDVDEWRTAPVRHRYVHGGFKGTEARFSFYMPAKAQYRGHFFQHATPVPDSENLAQQMPPGPYNKIGFAIDSGAYFVETNGGGHQELGKAATSRADPAIAAYAANAAAARFSRVVAQKMYGAKRPFGYIYGGSGGAYRSISAMENTRGVWDGAVPYVVGSTMAIPNVFTTRIRAMRVLNGVFPQIVDAVEPGGSGDPYAGLTPEQTAALREATAMGFPLPAWFAWRTMGIHGLAALYPAIKMIDRTYFTDFWTKPGYLGFDHPEQFANARIQAKTTITQLITGAEAAKLGINTNASNDEKRGGVDNAFRSLSSQEAERVVAIKVAGPLPPVEFLGGDLIVGSGGAAGKTIPLARLAGDIVVLGVGDPDVVAKLGAGDAVEVNNSDFLALETYHRHQVPGPDFRMWDQFRAPDGKPLYPQRSMLLGPVFIKASLGVEESGKFEGKMILLSSLWDSEAFPWQADWYRQRVAKQFGAAADQHVRLWYTDHAIHGDEPTVNDRDRLVSYQGVLQQALRDLSAWVEHGVVPPASTDYTFADGQVAVPATAAARKGIQPVVTLSVGGKARVDAAVGQSITFTGRIEVPPGAGRVVAAEWDFDGSGAFATRSSIGRTGTVAAVSITHAFAKPGTYFVALRGASQRQGNATTPYARIENLARVRVVVR